MESLRQTCPRCGRDLSDSIDMGATRCPECRLPLSINRDQELSSETAWRFVRTGGFAFFALGSIFFLLALGFIAVSGMDENWLGGFFALGGSMLFVLGFFVAWVVFDGPVQRVIGGIGFGLGFVFV